MDWWTTPGIYPDLDLKEYHARTPPWGSSALKRARTPAHARAEPRQVDRSAALAFGSAYHSAMELGIDRWRSERVAVMPDGLTLRHKEGKALAEQAEREGKHLLDEQEVEDIAAMCASARACRVSSQLSVGEVLQDSAFERSHIWADADTGLLCKCRPDVELPSGVLLDWKTCQDASERAVVRACASYGYALQAAHYLAGTGASMFVWVFVEKAPPFGAQCYFVRRDSIACVMGMEQRRKALGLIAQATAKNMWTSYENNARELVLPQWAIDQALAGGA